MFGNMLASQPYPRGTFCAAVGLIFIAAYYVRAWRDLQGRAQSSLTAGSASSPRGQRGPELPFLSCKTSSIAGSLWHFISVIFNGLWKSRSHTALLLRLMLMVTFSVIIFSAVTFGFWWIASQTALLLVVFLSAFGLPDVVFYSHRVRLLALKDNLQ